MAAKYRELCAVISQVRCGHRAVIGHVIAHFIGFYGIIMIASPVQALVMDSMHFSFDDRNDLSTGLSIEAHVS